MTVALPPEPAPMHYLQPCMIFADREEHRVCTILGSCISVCLFDPQLGLGGINHFMLPLWNGEGLPTPKYGNIAIEKLIEKMLRLQGREERLIAKVFGGARVLQGDNPVFGVGDRNISLAREALAAHGIRIACAEVGGTCGMRIEFNTRTGKVLLARLSPGAPNAVSCPDGRSKADLDRLRGGP